MWSATCPQDRGVDVDLTEEQWEVLEPLIPDPPRRVDGRGRPWRDPRDVLDAILWVLRTGAPWHDLHERYPPYQTCHRRFQNTITCLSSPFDAVPLWYLR
jgi:transposase